MNHKRQNQIENLAVSLLQETGCYTYPPIDVNKVARAKGLDVVEYEFDNDISGVLVTNAQGSYIGVNKNNWENRKRFTIAHELGHYTLGHQREGVFVDTPDKYFTIFNFRNSRSSTGEFHQEREANAFAASLLMPIELIMAVLKVLSAEVDLRKEEVDIVGRMADIFKVSNQAMGLRLSNLNSIW